MNKIRAEIAAMNIDNISICSKTLLSEKQRLRRKLKFLKSKYKPVQNTLENVSPRNGSTNSLRKKKRMKSSRECYANGKYRKELNDYRDNTEGRTVVNLSSIEIPLEDLFALEIGHGFILSPNNVVKEEEALILEGFRFMDRIGKAEQQISNQNENSNRNPDTNNPLPPVLISPSQTISSLPDDQPSRNYVRDSSVPGKLIAYQPKEEELSLAVTKLIKKEFEEVNTIVINSLKSKDKKRNFNLPKAARNSISKLKSLVKDRVIDIRKVDKGQIILIIDYAQRIRTEELNISTIAVLSEPQCSN